MVKMEDYGPNQRGLISREEIMANSRVMGMRQRYMRSFDERLWEITWRAEGKPDDGAIECYGTWYTDWTATGRRPLWYYLNHSNNPNLQGRLRRGRIVWTSVRRIRAGEQLTIDYGDVPGNFV